MPIYGDGVRVRRRVHSVEHRILDIPVLILAKPRARANLFVPAVDADGLATDARNNYQHSDVRGKVMLISK